MECVRCNKIGHKSEDCKQNQGSRAMNADTVAKTMCISSSCPYGKYIKTVIINGLSLEAFIDLGSEVTLIRKSDFTKIGFAHDHVPTLMKGFGNSVVRALGSAIMILMIDGVSATVSCRVVDDCMFTREAIVSRTNLLEGATYCCL